MTNNGDRKYLLVKGKAGLGNRILLLLEAMLYAEMSGRELVVDWRDRGYAINRQNSFNLLFETPEAGDPAALEAFDTVQPPLWRGHLAGSADELYARYFPDDEEADADPATWRRTSADARRLDWPETVCVRWGWTHELHRLRPHFTGHFAHWGKLTDEDILRAVLRDRLRPSARVRDKVAALRADFVGPILALHVRATDRANPYEGYRAYVDAFLKEHPDGGVFLATDNQEVEAYFRRFYERVHTMKKWFPPPGVPIHRNREDRDVVEAAVDALADMYLLGSCQGLVVNSTSSFGYVATLISEAPKKWRIDTAPRSWKNELKRVRNFVEARLPVHERPGLLEKLVRG